MSEKLLFNWSGGKDSSLTLYHLLKDKQYDIHCLLTSINSQLQRISMHGVRLELLEHQAESIGIPLRTLGFDGTVSMDEYNSIMRTMMDDIVEEGVTTAVFGDIFLEDLKQYREDKLKEAGMKGLFPIWKRPTTELAREFIDVGFKTILVCVDERHLDASFAGREFDDHLLADLPEGVDPCGENGEFHTFVYDGPIFQKPIAFDKGEVVYRRYEPPKTSHQDDYQGSCQTIKTGFWYQDLIPA